MEKTRTHILTWMAFAFYCFIWVSLDLWTTGIALNQGAHELSFLGNQPFVDYPAALFSVTICYLAALNMQKYNMKLLNIDSRLITLAVASLPVVAVLNNLAVIGYV